MKKSPILRAALLALTLVVSSCLNQNVTLSERWRNLDSLNNEDQTQSWLDDLERYSRAILKKHKDPFLSVNKESYLQELESFRNNLSDLDNLARYGELLRITSLLKDGNTQIRSGLPNSRFPFKFQAFDEGIYIVETDGEFGSLLGSKLLLIGSIPVDHLLPRLDPYLSVTNRNDLNYRRVQALESGELLAIAGIIESPESGVFTFLNNHGETETLLIPTGSSYFRRNLTLAEIQRGPDSPVLTGHDKAFFLHYMEACGAAVLQINSGYNKEITQDEMVQQLREMEETLSPRFLILDFRFNHGGDLRRLRLLQRYLEEESSLNKRGRLFAAIGNQTNGSIMELLLELEKNTPVIFIGEQTGGKPNHLGDPKSLLLSNIGIELSYPTKFFHMRERETPALDPQIPVTYLFEDYSRGVDSLLELIRKQAGSDSAE